jgi:ankyrin repeat protein
MPGKRTPLHLAALAGLLLLVGLVKGSARPDASLGGLWVSRHVPDALAVLATLAAGIGIVRASMIEKRLIRAACHGDSQTLARLLRRGSRVDRYDSAGRNALFYAVSNGHAPAVETLLQKGADRDQTYGRDGFTALLLAAGGGHLAVLDTLLDAGADPNMQPSGHTPLGLAVQRGITGAVPLLLARGAQVDARNEQGLTALMMACWWGHAEIARALIAAGAELEAVNVRGHSPLMIAAGCGHAEAVSVLLAAGAAVNQVGPMGDTALSAAAWEGQLETARLLIAAGADVHLSEERALLAACHAGHLALVQLLAAHGADLQYRDSNGDTALGVAPKQGHAAVAAWLRAAGAEP